MRLVGLVVTMLLYIHGQKSTSDMTAHFDVSYPLEHPPLIIVSLVSLTVSKNLRP